MNHDLLRVLILGGSGYIGKLLYDHLTEQGHQVVITYYDNMPDWHKADSGLYFDANNCDSENTLLNKVNDFDVIINTMNSEIPEQYENVLYKTPLRFAAKCSPMTTFITFNSLANNYFIDNKHRSHVTRLQHVLVEKEIGIPISCSPVISEESCIFKAIAKITKFRITPLFGDATNRIRPLHKTDFCNAIGEFLELETKPNIHLLLLGGDKHNIRHLYRLIAKKPPLFIPISKKIALKYSQIIEQIYEVPITNNVLETLSYEANHTGTDICTLIKNNILSFDARVKREGF